jgi:hypothetical protein
MTTTRIKFSDLCQFTPRQREASRQLKNGKRFLLYGGALGGGKSFWLRWTLLRRLMEIYAKFGLERVTVMLASEDYPSLKDRQLQKIEFEFPAWVGRMCHDHKVYGRAFVLHEQYGGGAICFRNLDDPSKYQSAEFAAIGVDELTKNTYEVFTHLRSRLRWPGLPDNETWFIAGTNPGGIGHGWVKQFWIDRLFPDEWTQPVDFRPCFAFVQSKADDNPHLDAAYWSTLQTLPPNLRKAFRDGDWDIFVGQAFPQYSRQTHGFTWKGDIPHGAPLYSTFDWGYGKPFSWGWWYVDADGRVWRFAEWYGWSGTADEGLRMVDSEIAAEIVKREREMGIWGRPIIRLAGHDCWNRKPNYQGGGQGPSTAEEFVKAGIYLTKADSTREVKIRQFRERLRVPEDGELPMLMVSDGCEQFNRTIPNLKMDDRNVEDVDSHGEDHIYDEACQICMARPLRLDNREWKPVNPFAARLDALEKGSIGRDPAIEALKSHNPWHQAMEHPAEWRINTGE